MSVESGKIVGTGKLEFEIIRPFTMETLIFGVLNGSHIDTSLFYYFLIIIPNRYSTTPMEIIYKRSK